ncbi:MAG TPA: TIM-barrel domain-containing protein [Jatrophihabitantaceae bacterium]|jgi:hypothetical protein
MNAMIKIGIAVAVLAASAVVAVPAAAKPASRTVVDGQARFEVLSPTLIRLEYAGDKHFTDAGTFNAVSRDTFTVPKYRTAVENGWRVIRTDQVTLKYRRGSGPFTADNVELDLNDGGTNVQAHPAWPTQASCTFGTLCQAENAALSGGASVNTNHSGYTGTGFVDGIQTKGAQLSYRLTGAPAGPETLQVRYANDLGGDGQRTTRTMSVQVDGQPAGTLTLPVTSSWDTWALASVPLQLTAGAHDVTVVFGPNDTGNVNVDSLAVTPPGASYPGPTPLSCPFATVCEAETGTLTGGATTASDHVGYGGSGFVAGLKQAGDTDTFTLTGVPSAGPYDVQVRYANNQGGDGQTTTRTLTVAGNQVSLAPTPSWDAWTTAATTVHLNGGDNTVAFSCGAGDSCNVNVDSIAVTPTNTRFPLSHLPLGGYRRSLDGVAGDAPITPGLLYRDGWSLLDDTSSALFDPATNAVTQRPTHDGPYQDGYLFGYGPDYQQALQDLRDLTGPAADLPRWAFGVWYSRYNAYSASDYENTLLPKFRSEGVPLDVLVTDTDWKSPDPWNGWEFDPTYFPDPQAYLTWAHQQGLHTTFNIHPSIQQADTQFTQAQATAGGALQTSNSCFSDQGHNGPCYVFDWGDPKQLQAYFDLHQTAEQQGVDFWWLDWCCEGSQSSLPGVTPDAWINDNYARDTSKNGQRGFAFSRAFSSLQSGGYSGSVGLPTGPWADHRYTVHFTGDTSSTWAALQYEVGYTGAEGASTGLPYTSHDIGGFNGSPADDLYVRWMQLGTFQPIDRLHSNHAPRLPWEYSDPARTAAEKFLRLREALVPYTYTAAREAQDTGVPIVRAPYLAYPDQPAAYEYAASEYLYGPNVLVAPATTPGTTSTTQVWFPPGTWTDYFTGASYTGPSVHAVTTGWDTMPVFVKGGGIVPERSDNVTNDVQNPMNKLTVDVAAGASGSYDLYEDAGDGPGGSATTPISYASKTLTIGPARGRFAGQPSSREWTARFLGVARPSTVDVDGKSTSAWSYDASNRTLTVPLAARPITARTTIKVS